jgi:hypothetical protein
LELMSSTKVTATDRQRFARARGRGREDASATNAVVNARYGEAADAIELVFRGGATVTIPCIRIPALADVPKRDLGMVSPSRAGDALSWRSLDIDIDVRGLIRRLFLSR